MSNTTTQARRFEVKGINDDRDFCMCCGKTGLKRVVWIEDTETSEVNHYGVVCATNPAKAFGLKKEIQSAVRAHDKAREDAERAARNEAFRIESNRKLALRDSLYVSRGGTYEQKEMTLRPGHFFTLASNQSLLEACHREVFPEQYRRP
jgi:hypothetical protein